MHIQLYILACMGTLFFVLPQTGPVSESRSAQLSLLRQLCLPQMCFLIHTVLHSTNQYSEVIRVHALTPIPLLSHSYSITVPFPYDCCPLPKSLLSTSHSTTVHSHTSTITTNVHGVWEVSIVILSILCAILTRTLAIKHVD